MPEIQHADRSLRHRVVSVLVVLAGCAAVVAFFSPPLHVLVTVGTDATQVRPVVASLWSAVAVFLCISVAAIGVYIVYVGRAVRRTGRFPLPGQRVLRDTVVVTGQVAADRARTLQFLGVMMILLACALAVTSWRLYILLVAF